MLGKGRSRIWPPPGQTTMTSDDDKDAIDQRFAARFQRVRDARQTEVAEDYVELIAELIDEMGEARAVDLAARLGVSKATVNNTIQRLQRDGLVTSQPYRAIFLTEKGRQVANASQARHAIVRDFLVALGVDPNTADADAEGMEHHVSAETLDKFRDYLRTKK